MLIMQYQIHIVSKYYIQDKHDQQQEIESSLQNLKKTKKKKNKKIKYFIDTYLH